MATNEFLANNVVFQTRSATLGGTWQTWVCNTSLSANLATAVNTVSTKCGVIKSVGELSGTVNFSGVANTAPTASEVSLKDALALANNQTLTEGRFVNLLDGSVALGEAVLIKGDGYVTSITPTADADGSLTFDAVFEFTGTIDIDETDES